MQKGPERFFAPLPPNHQYGIYNEILRFDPEKVWRVASSIVNTSQEIKEGDRLLLNFFPGSRQLAEMVAYQAAHQGAAVVLRCQDPTVEAALLAGIKNQSSQELLNDMSWGSNADIAWATNFIAIRCVDNPNAMDIVDRQILLESENSLANSQSIRIERRRWTLIYLPTKQEAEIDHMDFDQYVQMFLNACDRPWNKIKEAQQYLIDNILNPGENIEIYAGKNTHLKGSIKNQVFVNSTIGRNFPGSEVFSSPVRYTLEGTLDLPYPVSFGKQVILPNLKLTIEKGKVTEYQTTDPEKQKTLGFILGSDEGVKEVGEIALGTNRAFNRPLLNSLYVEKVGGSSHIALGFSHQSVKYDGKEINADNGVRSKHHIDLTFMMLPDYGGGKVLIDNKIIQLDGEFLDPHLAILNSK